jgi:hypothetical protein
VKVRAVVSLSWIKGADIIVCTVYHCFLPALLPLSLGAMLLQAILDPYGLEHASNIPTRAIEGGLALSVLAFSTAICVFCLQCMRAIWPRVFRGECHSAISKTVANEWIMLVGPRRDALLFIISSVIFIAYSIYLVRITV